jgi:hypothetical protein
MLARAKSNDWYRIADQAYQDARKLPFEYG